MGQRRDHGLRRLTAATLNPIRPLHRTTRGSSHAANSLTPVRNRYQTVQKLKWLSPRGLCRTIKSPLKNKEVRRSSFQPNDDPARSGAAARAIRRSSMPSRLNKRRQFYKSHPLVCGRRAAWGGNEVDHICRARTNSSAARDEIPASLVLRAPAPWAGPRTNRPTPALDSPDWAPCPKIKTKMQSRRRRRAHNSCQPAAGVPFFAEVDLPLSVSR